MGDQAIQSEATQADAEGGLASYIVREYSGRELPRNYRGLVLAKWIRGLRHGNDFFKLIDPDPYHNVYNAFIDNILLRPDSVVRLAVLPEDEDVVLGFSVCRDKILDWVYVLRVRTPTDGGVIITDYRRHGIGSKLIPTDITTFTHLTKTWMSLWASRYKHLKFNPFA